MKALRILQANYNLLIDNCISKETAKKQLDEAINELLELDKYTCNDCIYFSSEDNNCFNKNFEGSSHCIIEWQNFRCNMFDIN